MSHFLLKLTSLNLLITSRTPEIMFHALPVFICATMKRWVWAGNEAIEENTELFSSIYY